MRNLVAATLYPGIGLLESVVSVGRGTDNPFEVVGAPYIDDVEVAAALNQADLAGLSFVPVQFTPSSSIFHGQLCKGVKILLQNRELARPVDAGITISELLYRLYPEKFQLEKIAHLLLHPQTLEAIKGQKPLQEIHAMWAAELENFKNVRQRYLLY